jgi:ABC-2 type transport system permease protein
VPATIFKGLLFLSRDRAGLLVLFLMLAVLVIVVSLVQEHILKVTGETAIRVLLVDQDRQLLGQMIENQLQQSGTIEIAPADSFSGKTA